MSELPAAAVDPAGSGHVPVLFAEVLEGLAVKPGGRYIDGTLGGGGHTSAILAQAAPGGALLGLDADPAAIRRVTERLAAEVAEGALTLVHTPFRAMAEVARAHGFGQVDGILLDLGLSSFQLETAERGFSFAHDGPLDMRFNPEQRLTAAEIVNYWTERELADLIFQFGDEAQSRRIARYLVQRRPFQSTTQLAAAVEAAVGGRRGSRIHPATRTFQALRIAVNEELRQLEELLPDTIALLKPGGRLAVISFHSLEDRIVKQWMQQEARSFVHEPALMTGGYERTPAIRVLTRKPIEAGEAEVAQNPRSRSAKLRIAERLP